MSLLEEAKQAKSAHRTNILAKPNVVGLGVGYKETADRVTDELSVVVLVRHKVPLVSLPTEGIIPQEVNGVRTDVMQVGEIRPLQSRTDRWRPAPGSVSIGHFEITAGTFGCTVHDQESGERLVLSNNHVLANSNSASLGDPILQPGPMDGGRVETDTIAHLERFSPIRFNSEPPTCDIAMGYARLGNFFARMVGSSHKLQVHKTQPAITNTVDAAVARPLEDGDILDEILDIGVVSGTVTPELGLIVRKSGRTSATTTGSINILDATIVVNYGYDRLATFESQIISTPMSRGGDSGSLVVADDSLLAVGLLFAGSDQATIFNPIQAVIKALNVRFPGTKGQPKTDRHIAVERAQAIKEAYGDLLMSKANVVGVGIGLRHKGGNRTDEVGLVVMVRRKLPNALLAPEDVIPDQIEGVPIDVREVGEVEAQ